RITIENPALDGLEVTRDGTRVDRSIYGVDVPVDPGTHTMVAIAPDRVRWSTRVVVSNRAEIVVVAIPELMQMPARPAAPDAPAGSGRRVSPAVWITGGIGAVGIGIGTGFGLAARALWRQASTECTASDVCTDKGYALAERSRRDGDLSTLSFAIAGAAIVTGIALYLRTSRD